MHSSLDWIDREYHRREAGQTRALSQDDHAQVNARYPGCTAQTCDLCGEPTGRCEEDSITSSDGEHTICEECSKNSPTN